jgi:hypothetical protein
MVKIKQDTKDKNATDFTDYTDLKKSVKSVKSVAFFIFCPRSRRLIAVSPRKV